MSKKKVAIIGGGPSALTAADHLDHSYNVIIYEKEKTIGQKFLVAGKGGFNLTNSKTGHELTKQYTPINFMKNAILSFDSKSTQSWLKGLGIETYSGTSGRVFSEKKHKSIDVLNAIRNSLIKKNVKIFSFNKFIEFDKSCRPVIAADKNHFSLEADYYIFGLGGASWSVTGSDGKWLDSFIQLGIKTQPFQASNCGINIEWSEQLLANHLGKPLKNISVSIMGNTFKGEAVITDYGLEGNAVYSIVPYIRESLTNQNKGTFILIDLKPNNTKKELKTKVHGLIPNSTNYKKALNLLNHELFLIKSLITKNDFRNPNIFIDHVKGLNIRVNSLRPIEEAISTIGGIDISEMSPNFSLKKYPNIFAVGEMINWDAPTGGFLLQGCFSMGYYAAMSINSANN